LAGSGYISIPLRGAALRCLFVATVVLAAGWAAVGAVRAAAAGTVVELADRYPIPPDVLEHAVELDPANPQTSYLLGLYYLDLANPPDPERARPLLERALESAPNRDHLWLTLGRLQESAGPEAQAEVSFQRAIRLAPNSWRALWMLGNFYVRRGRLEEAIAPLREAAARNVDLAGISVRTVWEASGHDVGTTERLGEGNDSAQLALVGILLNDGRLDEAASRWAGFVGANADHASAVSYGNRLADAYLKQGRGGAAVHIYSLLYPDRDLAASALRNPSFEEPVDGAKSPFEWKVTQSPEARVSAGAGHSGARALKVDYDARRGTGFVHATQLVAVTPGAHYALVFWAATTDVRTGGAPAVSVNGVDGLSASQPLPSGTSDWTQYQIAFTAPKSGVVNVSVARASCGDVCPIFGTILIDDFELRSR
jgi:hypothetical protein